MSTHCLNQQHLHLIRHTPFPPVQKPFCVQLCLLVGTIAAPVLAPSLFMLRLCQSYCHSLVIVLSLQFWFVYHSLFSSLPVPFPANIRLLNYPLFSSHPIPFPNNIRVFIRSLIYLDLTHACLTTMNFELPLLSLFAIYDPCLSDHELHGIKPPNFLKLVWQLVPLPQNPDSVMKLNMNNSVHEILFIQCIT